MHQRSDPIAVLINGDRFWMTHDILPYITQCETKPISKRDALRHFEIEKWTYQQIRNTLTAGDTALDVGAYIGILSVLMSRSVGPTGKVFAFEPNPDACSHLSSVLRINHALNVEIVPAAIAQTSGTRDFFQVLAGDVRRECSTLKLEPALHYLIDVERRIIRVPTMTIDEFVEARSVIPNLLKIDVEGAECEVVAGAEQTIRRWHPKIQLELHDIAQDAFRHIFELLRSYGYTLTRRDYQVTCV